MNADGSGVEQLTDNDYLDDGPAWSPDGGRIAFYSDREEGGDGLVCGIYVMNSDGSGVSRLSGASGSCSSGRLAWSPDGDRIVFDSWFDIYVANADGSGVVLLTNNTFPNDLSPAWSPDGERIAFHSNRGGDWGIYVMNADGSGAVRLAEGYDPSWSPLVD